MLVKFYRLRITWPLKKESIIAFTFMGAVMSIQELGDSNNLIFSLTVVMITNKEKKLDIRCPHSKSKKENQVFLRAFWIKNLNYASLRLRVRIVVRSAENDSKSMICSLTPMLSQSIPLLSLRRLK